MTDMIRPAPWPGWYKPRARPKIACHEGSGDAKQNGDDDAAGILAGHDQFGECTGHQADDTHPHEVHI